jgi:HAMP domain-containing protein
MASNLTAQVRNIAEVATAIANGDLSKKITVGRLGRDPELKDTLNTMVVQLNAFASEVTRVAREVGTEGKLGGRRRSRRGRHLEGPHRQRERAWRRNLTAQVRNIAEVTTAVARGDLSRKITVRREGRSAGAQGHHQHHGGPAQRLRG